MMYRKLMVPLDGSTLSEKALPYVIRLANRLEAEVLLLRVVETQTLLTTTPQHRKEALQKGEAYLQQIRRVITDPGFLPYLKPDQVQTLCVYGSAVEEISRAATSEKVDMSIMTTHGRNGLSRLVAGSVASRVLHDVALPLMLIRPTEQKYSQLLEETLYGLGEPTTTCLDDSGGGQILLALDGSPEAAAGIEPAIELARKLGSTLHLLKVMEPAIPVVYSDMYGLSYTQDQIDRMDAENTMQAHSYLDKIQKQVQGSGLECVKVIKMGKPAREILGYSRQIGAQAIIMTSHKRSEIAQFFLGNIAQAVLHESHLPVLMVPTVLYLKETDTSPAEQPVAVVSK
jgi:nucleotide-binding universal stress UspA family protein